MSKVRAAIAWAVVLLIGTGCGNRHKPYPVSGLVTLDGKPVEGASVHFHRLGDEREGRPAFGSTDRTGTFRLNTLGNEDGALPGEYKVVISKWVPSDPGLKVPNFPDTPEGRAQREDFLYRYFGETKSPIKNALPEIYGDLKTTPLHCSVKGATTTKFEMTSKPPGK